MSKIDLYGAKTLPDARTRAVMAGMPGTADLVNRRFRILPELQSVSSIFENMPVLPMSDETDMASVEVAQSDVGPFLATCAHNKRETWGALYEGVSGAMSGQVQRSAFLSEAVQAEKAKAMTAVQRFIDSVAPASRGNRLFEVHVRGLLRAETPSTITDYDDDGGELESRLPTRADFVNFACSSGSWVGDLVIEGAVPAGGAGALPPAASPFARLAGTGSATEPAAALPAQPPAVVAADGGDLEATPEAGANDGTMDAQFHAEPFFFAEATVPFAVIASSAEQAEDIARLLLNDVQAPTQDMIDTVRGLYLERKRIEIDPQSMRPDSAQSSGAVERQRG